MLAWQLKVYMADSFKMIKAKRKDETSLNEEDVVVFIKIKSFLLLVLYDFYLNKIKYSGGS